MFWRFWRRKLRVLRGSDTPPHAESDGTLVGPESDARFASVAAFIVAHRTELQDYLLAATQRNLVVSADPAEPLPDFGWPYKARRHIASGAMGDVYEAADDEFGRRVAIKVSRLGAGTDEAQVYCELLAREQRHLGPLSHDNIVHVYRCGELSDGRFWFAMEFVRGVSLLEYVQSGTLKLRDVVELILVLARAVGWLHDQGIVHADLKPGNILVNEVGTPKVIDFGMARVIGASPTQSKAMPSSCQEPCPGRGTPGYRAPELAASGRADFRADIYSLGTILDQLLTDKLPTASHDPTSPNDSAEPSRTRARRRIPWPLAVVIAKCCETCPDDRYRSANELAGELDRWLSSRPPRAVVGPLPMYRASLALRRHRWQAASIVIAICALTAVLLAKGLTDHHVELSAQHAQAEQTERQRADAEQQRANREQDRLQTERHRAAIQLTRDAVHERRPDAAHEALRNVPALHWGIEGELLRRQTAAFPQAERVIGAHDWGVVDCLTAPGVTVSAGHDGRLLVWSDSAEPHVLRDGHWNSSERRYAHVLAGEPKTNQEAATTALAWLEPGQAFVETTLAGTAAIWNLDDRLCRDLVRHTHPLLVAAVSAKTQTVLLGDAAGTLLVYHLDGRLLRQMTTDAGAITALGIVGNATCWIGHASGAAMYVDFSTGATLAQTSFPGPIWQLAPSPDLKCVAIACQRPAAVVCTFDADTANIRQLATLALPSADQAPPQAVHAVSFSPDGTSMFVVDDLGRVLSFDAQSHELDFVRDDQGASPIPVTLKQAWPETYRRVSAGVVFSADGRSFVTAGHDTLIKVWVRQPDSWMREIRVDQKPLLAFAPSPSSILWVATQDGRLHLFDADTAIEAEAIDTGHGRIDALAAAARQPTVATAGDQSIRLWTPVNHTIQPLRSPIPSAAPVHSLALTPDGERVAAYCTDGALRIWQVASATLLAQRRFPLPSPDSAGRAIAFNCTGDRLGLLTAPRSVHVLDAETLVTTSEPQLVAGQGGTAIVWHPTDPAAMFAGDTIGRVAGTPAMEIQQLPQDAAGHAPIAALSVTPDGQRVVAATTTGRLVMIEQRHWGALLTYQPRQAPANSPLVDLAVSSTGRLLATSYEDGAIVLLRLADSELPSAPTSSEWSERICLQGPQAANLRLRPESVAMDRDGAIHAVYLKTDPPRVQHPPSWNLVLGSESPSGWRERVLSELGPLSSRARDAIQRSLGLAIQGDTLWAIAKSRIDGVSGKPTPLTLFSRNVSSDDRPTSETISEEPNEGFDPVMTVDENGRFSVLHFSHAGHYLLCSRKSRNEWATIRIGRQGDGFWMRAASAPAELMHLIFRPTRFNDDQSSPACLTLDMAARDGGDLSVIRRRVCTGYRARSWAVASLPTGSPAVLYELSTPDGGARLMLARWTVDRWLEQTVFDRVPPESYFANMHCDAQGTVRFAAKAGTTGEVWLVTVPEADAAGFERIWRDTRRSDEEDWIELIPPILVDPAGEPVVLIARPSAADGYIRIVRRRQHLRRAGNQLGH